jgi:hypothetical protein
MVFGMDAGDADVEPVVGALDDGELVLAFASLRVRKASTRVSGRARADDAPRERALRHQEMCQTGQDGVLAGAACPAACGACGR